MLLYVAMKPVGLLWSIL